MPRSRFSARLFSIAALAVLALGLTVVPCHLAGQQGAPPAEPSPAAVAASASGQASPKPEAAEKNESDAFRHTALVQTLARTFHLDIEAMARTLELINFAIIVLAILIPLSRFLPKVFRKRSETLREKIESARKVTEDANARLGAVEEKLSRLDQEVAAFRSEVEREMAADEQRIKASIEEERARIVSAAEQEIVAAAAHAQRSLRNFAADLAIEQAAKQMKLTPETDRALIAEFVAGVNGGKGGQN